MMQMLVSRVSRLGALCFCLALVLALAACSHLPEKPTKGDDYKGIGPFPPVVDTENPPSWTSEELSNAKPTRLRIRNVMGEVHVMQSHDAKFRIQLDPKEDKLPAFYDLREFSGGFHFFALDNEGDMRSAKPEQPSMDGNGQVSRHGLNVPRVDVNVWVPINTILTVDACTTFDLDANGSFRARCGDLAKISGGRGTAMLWAPKVEILSSSFDLYAETTRGASISGLHGAKFLRGEGDVEISGGSGLLNIDILGDVLAKTIVSGGMPQTNMASFAHRDNFALIGPKIPVFGTRSAAYERARIGSTIKANAVRVYLDPTSRLEVEVQVYAGLAKYRFSNPSIVSLHEWSPSTGSISIGDPTGELKIRARTSSEVLVE